MSTKGMIFAGIAAAGIFGAAAHSMSANEPQSCHLNADGIVELTMGNGKVVQSANWRVTDDNKTCYTGTNPPILVPVR